MIEKTTKILLAEDDPNFGLMLKGFLDLNDYQVTWTKNGHEALIAYQSQTFDLCIFDVMMPNKDGFSLATDLKKMGNTTPILFLTARAMREDKIKGYQLGAIDYLVKPFDPEILILKIQAVLRQTTSEITEKTIFKIGNYRFDYAKRQLILKENTQKLTPKDADLLRLLCEKEGKVLTREEALIKIWKEDNYFTAQSMNVFISKLRKYLAKDPEHHIEIENLHGKGFVLRQDKSPKFRG